MPCMSALLLQTTTPPAITDALHRIAVTLTISTIALIIIALFFLGGLAASLFIYFKLNQTLKKANQLGASVKTRVDALLHMADELQKHLGTAAEDVKLRVQEFGAVVEIVQQEAQEL